MDNCTIVMFGFTGDLARRKLIPSLYRLIKEKKLVNFAIIGAGIEDIQVEDVLSKSKQFIEGDVDDNAWQKLQKAVYYQQLNAIYKEDYEKLCAYIQQVEKKHALSGNRLFYLAVAAHFFCPITHHLAHTGCAQRKAVHEKPWHRIVYEKPFGHDLQTAHEINECIKKSFNESQIYRIDHYLTKELVSNITLVRFTNCVFEPLWNQQYIDQVQIVLSETVGVEQRGAYYDNYGALRDVVQNHMLELLALICMETPEKLTGESVRNQRAKVLEKVRVVDGILGQYDSYTDEASVDKKSKTETFAALQLMVDNPRWAGVPFYLKTGKYLDKKETIVHVKFKQVECRLAKCPTESNWLTIKISPDATFSLSLNVKKPGYTDEVIPVAMEFCHSCIFGEVTPEAYDVVFDEVIRGEQAISVRFDEIEFAWRIVDAMYAKHFPLYIYKHATDGPKELEEFGRKHGMRWRT